MAETRFIGKKEQFLSPVPDDTAVPAPLKQESVPASPVESLQEASQDALKLVDDIILKRYLHRLSSFEVLPLAEDTENIEDISNFQLFRITEMVYQSEEYSTYKFASVFNSIQHLNCAIFIIADSDGKKTQFYMGVRSRDKKRTASSLKNTMKNALMGQFPGVKVQNLMDDESKKLLAGISDKNIASVSCVAQNKDENFRNNQAFIQGLEKMALAMQGQVYTAVVLAQSIPAEELDQIRNEYETIYSRLSPLANAQVSYGTNESASLTNSMQLSESTGTSHSESTSKSYNKTLGETHGTSVPDKVQSRKKAIFTALSGVAGVVTAPLTGGASLALAGVLGAANTAISMIPVPNISDGNSVSYGETISKGITNGTSETASVSAGTSNGQSSGTSQNTQLTLQDKRILNIMERIDKQLHRIDESESVGMWKCAAYFMANTQETAEMAAGTYKAIMKGQNSGVETTALNFWNWQKEAQRKELWNYITHFVHPKFRYPYTQDDNHPLVDAASLVTGNELAIHMGLPRKSVCGFPVIEHAEFGQEIIQPQSDELRYKIRLGKINSMGKTTDATVALDCKKLTEHTFITGSTGAGKSNTTSVILQQFSELIEEETDKVHFLVVEPAKGEYADAFPQANIYGADPRPGNSELLRLNPFAFPKQIHILHHIDRLVEIFNVCWPMYAAMPALLKKAIHNAYEECGWDMETSEQKYHAPIFPTFRDVLDEIRLAISQSDYSEENKGNYTGSLVTRVESLTTGIYGLVFCSNGVADQTLFDENTIVDLSSIGSTETKSLIMGILVLKLQEYRMSQNIRHNADLRHITVLEEAHHLLRRTSVEQSSESSNLLGKSVEMLTNAIAEMRTYGEGFIIADQSPGLLDMAVIRNTNTKIIHRLPDYSDRELVGRACGLNDDQITELSRLDKGVAVIRQSEWLEPVLCKVERFTPEEKPSQS